MKQEVEVVFSRASSNHDKGHMEMVVRDKESMEPLMNLCMSFEDFAKAVTGLTSDGVLVK